MKVSVLNWSVSAVRFVWVSQPKRLCVCVHKDQLVALERGITGTSQFFLAASTFICLREELNSLNKTGILV